MRFLLSGETTTKVASLSTSYLRVYEDDPNDPKNIVVPNVKEPTTKVLHEIRLECFGDHDSCGYGFQVQVEHHQRIRALNCISYNKTGGSGFDLLFDSTVDKKEFLSWNKAVQEAEELRTKSRTLLDELKLEIVRMDSFE